MRIIHISDLHLKSTDKSFYALDPLFKDMKEMNEEREIDLIIFSGDLIDAGGSSFIDITLGFMTFEEKVIERAQKELNINRNQFIISAGNHDVDRNLDSNIIEKGLAATLIDFDSIRDFQENKTTYTEMERIKPYKKFEEYLYDDSKNVTITPFETLHELNILDKKVAVLSLNTSWRCYDSKNESGNLILGEKQIVDHVEALEKSDIKIAVMHHSYKELKEFEQNRIKNLLNQYFDIVFMGHVHREDAFAFKTEFGATIYSTSSSNSEYNSRPGKDYENAYSTIDIDTTGTTIYFRKYSSRKLSYVPNVDFGDDKGMLFIKNSSKEDIAEKKAIETIINDINEVYEDTANQHLLSYRTDSIAPKEIGNLFVMPRVTSKGSYDLNSKNDSIEKKGVEYNLDKICFYKKNIIFTGQKEIGKTVLLDKLFLELSSNYSKYRKIPVLINYIDLKKDNLLQIIARFLHVTVKELRNTILNKEKIVLMIDDSEFYQDNSILSKIDKFLDNYSNIQLIFTVTAFTEDTIQFQQLNYNFLKEASMLRIENFKTKEIRELITNWFANVDTDKQPVSWSVGDIIDKFNQLNLPSTPMAVSMFLWIFEKQDTYAPVNNAQMLENFLERIFHKSEQEYVYSSDFTYKNKDFLLTSIAYFMYENNNPEYSLEFEDLRSFIVDHLDDRMFPFSADDILNEFLNIGILIDVKNTQNRTIKFRFSSFFQFYLMKNIDSKTGFRENILKDDNCIQFMHELDYYTGLNMNDSNLLEEVIEKMLLIYKPFKVAIEDQSEYNYDTFLETTKSFTDTLTDKKIEAITTEIKQLPDNSTKANDDILETTDKKSQKIESKENPTNSVELLQNYWILAGTILRNSEEIENSQLKKDSLKNVVDCSLIFASLIKIFLIEELKEFEDNSSIDQDLIDNIKFINLFLPNLHQELVTQVLGTVKLSIALKERLGVIINDTMITDLEKFTYTFMIFDLNDNDKYVYVDELIKNRKKIYIKDSIFVKLLHQFLNNTISSNEESRLKTILAELRADHPSQKGSIINDLGKKKRLLSVNKKQ